DDVDAAAEQIRAAGVEVKGPVNQPVWSMRVAHLRDPDGHLIELGADLPRA
ncbi:MAG: VOC family protein, partial [Planctomycetota bacterium]